MKPKTLILIMLIATIILAALIILATSQLSVNAAPECTPTPTLTATATPVCGSPYCLYLPYVPGDGLSHGWIEEVR